MRILIRIGAFRFTGKSKQRLLWEALLWFSNSKARMNHTSELFDTEPKGYPLPALQRNPVEDAFDEIELLGFPQVELELAVDRPAALVAVRLCDVAPDGTSVLVTRGLLNLTHRASHEEPSPLEPGRRYTVHVRLNAIGQAMAAGHHLRVAVSPTYWPWAWPSPEPVALTLFAGRLRVPVRPPRAEDVELRPFGEPEWAPPLDFEVLNQAPAEYVVSRDHVGGVYELVRSPRYGPGAVRYPDGLEYEQEARDCFRIVEGEPLSASCHCEYGIAIGRGDWRTRVESVSTMSADAEAFHVTSAVNAYEGSARVFAKTWSVSIPRDLL